MKNLEDVEAVEREKAMMECDVSDPGADVTWFRDGKVSAMGQHPSTAIVTPFHDIRIVLILLVYTGQELTELNDIFNFFLMTKF